jgi:hypothetical protein
MRCYEKYLGYEPLTATYAILCYTLAGKKLVLYPVSATESKMLLQSNSGKHIYSCPLQKAAYFPINMELSQINKH